jgi:hypothetical protein
MKRTIVLAVLLAASCVCARAGTTGTLVGSVRASSNLAPVAGVQVTLSSPTERLVAMTDRNGRFAFVGLDSGRYDVVLNHKGWRTITFDGDMQVSSICQQQMRIVVGCRSSNLDLYSGTCGYTVSQIDDPQFAPDM